MDYKASSNYIARPAQKRKKRRREGGEEGGKGRGSDGERKGKTLILDATYEVGNIYVYEKKSQKYPEGWGSAIKGYSSHE